MPPKPKALFSTNVFLSGRLTKLFSTTMIRFKTLQKVALWVVCLGCAINSASALTNGLALTPPMGYNSWYANGTGISDAFLRSVADQMVSTGMRDVGYQYLCLDDGWAGSRDTNGLM